MIEPWKNLESHGTSMEPMERFSTITMALRHSHRKCSDENFRSSKAWATSPLGCRPLPRAWRFCLWPLASRGKRWGRQGTRGPCYHKHYNNINTIPSNGSHGRTSGQSGRKRCFQWQNESLKSRPGWAAKNGTCVFTLGIFTVNVNAWNDSPQNLMVCLCGSYRLLKLTSWICAPLRQSDEASSVGYWLLFGLRTMKRHVRRACCL